MEPFPHYAERNFMMVLIKLPQHIPEIQENTLLKIYTVILGNNYEGDDEENNNGETRDMVSACDVVSLIRLRKSKNGETEGI
jgi:hypothetical protein